MNRKIAIASEHAGFSLKESLKNYLVQQGYEVDDLGTDSGQPVDYPSIAADLAGKVISGCYNKGILICGTGIGMCIAAYKVTGVRAALCSDIFDARMARLHNDANILCLGAWKTGPRIANEMTSLFLETEFEGGRHIPRINGISEIEKNRSYPVQDALHVN